MDKMAEKEAEPSFRPDRYYVIGDAGSLYLDPETGEGAEGFETPRAAADWARRQATWPELPELFSDGVSAIIALGNDLNANAAAWDAWDGRGDWPDAPAVHNHARDLGLVTESET
jgi:hypothetical protein